MNEIKFLFVVKRGDKGSMTTEEFAEMINKEVAQTELYLQ